MAVEVSPVTGPRPPGPIAFRHELLDFPADDLVMAIAEQGRDRWNGLHVVTRNSSCACDEGTIYEVDR